MYIKKKNKQEYIFEWRSNETLFGRTKKKTASNFVFYKYWMEERSHDNMITSCNGCNLSIRNPQNIAPVKCVIRSHITNICLINNIRKMKSENQPVMKTLLPTILQSCITNPHTQVAVAKKQMNWNYLT